VPTVPHEWASRLTNAVLKCHTVAVRRMLPKKRLGRWPPLLQLVTVAASFVTLTAFAVCTFYIPFTGDQALFAIAAEELQSGYVLYRDFWDIKQPGIFWWYALARSLPGGDLVGVRLLELMWQTATAILLIRVMRNAVTRPWIAYLTPVLALGPYFVTGGLSGWGLALIEPMIGMPILLMLVNARKAFTSDQPNLALLVVGIAMGLVILFKALYILVALPVLIVTALVIRAADKERPTEGGAWRGFHSAMIVSLGASVLIGAAVVYAAVTNSLGLLLETTFVQPLRVRQLPEFTSQDVNLLHLAETGLTSYGWSVILAGIGFAARRTQPWLVIPVLTWAATACATMLVQAPNAYQVYALLVPVGILAGVGLNAACDVAATCGKPGKLAVAGSLVVSCIAAWPMSRTGLDTLAVIRDHAPALSASDRLEVGRAINSEFRQVSTAAETLPRSLTSSRAPIYVFGSPLWYRELDSRQAVEVQGWTVQYNTEAVWAELERELRRTRPRAVFVDEFSASFIEERRPGILGLLERSYEPVWQLPAKGDWDAGAGTWWVTSAPGQPAPTPEGNQLRE